MCAAVQSQMSLVSFGPNHVSARHCDLKSWQKKRSWKMRKRKKVVVTTFAIVSDFHTDRFLHEAIVKDLNDGVLDNTVLKTSEKHGNFRKLCRSLKVVNGVLMYKGQRNEYPPVHIPEQVGNLLYKVHIRDWKKGKNVGKTELYRGVQ